MESLKNLLFVQTPWIINSEWLEPIHAEIFEIFWKLIVILYVFALFLIKVFHCSFFVHDVAHALNFGFAWLIL